MDSIDAHKLVLGLLTEENAFIALPDQWCHRRTDGSLTYHFAGGERSFTWDAAQVASMAADWRAAPKPSPIADWLDERWRALDRMLVRGGLEPPDEIHVDHRHRELRLLWIEPKLCVVIEDDDEASGRPAA